MTASLRSGMMTFQFDSAGLLMSTATRRVFGAPRVVVMYSLSPITSTGVKRAPRPTAIATFVSRPARRSSCFATHRSFWLQPLLTPSTTHLSSLVSPPKGISDGLVWRMNTGSFSTGSPSLWKATTRLYGSFGSVSRL